MFFFSFFLSFFGVELGVVDATFCLPERLDWREKAVVEDGPWRLSQAHLEIQLMR